MARLLLSVLLMCLPLTACDRAADMQDAERRLTAGIPDYAAPADVMHYLDGQKIEHSGYERQGTPANTIHATIRERIVWRLVQRAYTAVYRFDAHDHLVEKVVGVKYTAL